MCSEVLLTIMTKRMETSGAIQFAEAKTSGTVPTSVEGLAQLKQQIESTAMLDGINFSFFVSTIVAAVALFLALFIQRVTRPKSTEE